MRIVILTAIFLPASIYLLFSRDSGDLPEISYLKVNSEETSAFLESSLSRNQLEVDADGNVYVGFSGVRRGKKDTDVFFRRFDQNREAWDDLISISQEHVPPASGLQTPAFLDRGAALWVSPQGIVHYAWLAHDEKTGEVAVQYRRSEKGGEDWSELLAFEVGSTVARYPQITGDESGNVYLYITNALEGEKERLLVYYSRDAGRLWNQASVGDHPSRDREGAGPLENLNLISRDPQLLAGEAGRAYLVWLDTKFGGMGILFSRTEDGGKTWSEPVPLNSDHTQVLHEPRIQKAGDDLLVTWMEREGPDSNVYWNRSSDEGQSWEGEEVLFSRRVTSVTTGMWGGSDTLLFIWSDYRNKMQYGAKRDKGERLWSSFYKRGNGWIGSADSPERSLVTLQAKDESYYTGFDAAPLGSAGGLVAYAEHISGYRRAVHGTFWDEADGFKKSFRISEPIRMVDSVWPKAERVSEKEVAVIYNQVRARMSPQQPKSWLGDLILSRIQIQ